MIIGWSKTPEWFSTIPELIFSTARWFYTTLRSLYGPMMITFDSRGTFYDFKVIICDSLVSSVTPGWPLQPQTDPLLLSDDHLQPKNDLFTTQEWSSAALEWSSATLGYSSITPGWASTGRLQGIVSIHDLMMNLYDSRVIFLMTSGWDTTTPTWSYIIILFNSSIIQGMAQQVTMCQ